jgi:crossover junction endodeoxyribonuclease RuvC
MRILGLDPGLLHTGWGIIESNGNRHQLVASGCINPPAAGETAVRLLVLDRELARVLELYQPHAAAVEETFVNKNASSTLKLGHARGVVLLAPAKHGIPVAEYPANLVKKTVVGAGHADKNQVMMMVGVLLNAKSEIKSADAADALAVAICHAHHMSDALRRRA